MRWTVLLSKAAITIALIAWVFSRTDLSTVVARAGALSPSLMVATLTLVLAQYLLFATRWWLVGHAIGAVGGWMTALRYTVISLFFNQVLLSGIGGDAVRVYLVTRDKVLVRRAIAGVMLDRLVALLALLLLVVATLPLFLALVANPVLRGVIVGLIAAEAAAFTLLLVAGDALARLLERWALTRAVASVFADLRDLFRRTRTWIGALVVSSTNHLISGGVAVLLAASMDIPLGLGPGLVLMFPVILAASLPISIAGWGVREGAMVVVLAEVGLPAADTLALSLVYGFIYLVTGLIGGVVWLADSRRHKDAAPTSLREGAPGI
jgi:uncharacterized membrane protein YbhN (UPF0104 family)